MGVIEILKWIWQLPQHLIAVVYYLLLRMRKQVLMVEKGEDGACIICTKGTMGNISFGKYVFVSFISSEETKKHEMGHSKQSLYLGPLYLIVIGIPSIVWALTHRWLAPNKPYDWFFTEAWANRLAGLK